MEYNAIHINRHWLGSTDPSNLIHHLFFLPSITISNTVNLQQHLCMLTLSQEKWPTCKRQNQFLKFYN